MTDTLSAMAPGDLGARQEDDPGPARPRFGGRRKVAVVACIVGYLLLAFLAAPTVWIHGPTTHLWEGGTVT